ncbi:amino acid deaminase [Allopusillimonas ginsengisoli]|uniref:amino acid deaminase n=1 Tax=Allopusillimonas ginsengisoli TaxID=453575 RepID=UPI001FD6F30A|nr:amino acid deaminase [Allopusillimonas ginsengisoli]
MEHSADKNSVVNMSAQHAQTGSGSGEDHLDAVQIDARYKGYPTAAEPCAISNIAKQSWNLYRDDLPYPVAVLKEDALSHNLAWMQAYAAQHGVDIAPHGKTTMSPQIFRRQLAAGAWGLTFATVFQVQAGVRAGARRIIIANQVLARADLDALAAILARHEDLTIWFLIDSVAQIDCIEAWAASSKASVTFDCLLEVGAADQRTGCRTREHALAVAQRAKSCPVLRLGGIACYEGGLAHCELENDRERVGAFMDIVRDIAMALDEAGLFVAPEIIVSAGGSAVFDLVLPAMAVKLSRAVRGVLRSGCYITHDHGFYRHMLHNVEQRQGLDASLRPALEVWSMVQSTPQPGLAILTCGKRDISFDLALPVVVSHVPRGCLSGAPAPQGWLIDALNDQHAYLRYDPDGAAPEVGDRVVLGMSHPCTTFDKWAWLPVVDGQGNVVDAVTTCF